MSGAAPTPAWSICMAALRRHEQAVMHDGDDLVSLCGQGADGAWYDLVGYPDGDIAVMLHGEDGRIQTDFFYEVPPGRAAYQSVTGQPAPDELLAAVTGFVPVPRPDEVWVYRPGREVLGLQMWRAVEDVDGRAPCRPGADPAQPWLPTYLTVRGERRWPQEQHGKLSPAPFWKLVAAGLMVPLAGMYKPSCAPLWLDDDSDDEGGVEWIGPCGPGLPKAGVYLDRTLGDRVPPTQYRLSMREWMDELVAMPAAAAAGIRQVEDAAAKRLEERE